MSPPTGRASGSTVGRASSFPTKGPDHDLLGRRAGTPRHGGVRVDVRQHRAGGRGRGRRSAGGRCPDRGRRGVDGAGRSAAVRRPPCCRCSHPCVLAQQAEDQERGRASRCRCSPRRRSACASGSRPSVSRQTNRFTSPCTTRAPPRYGGSRRPQGRAPPGWPGVGGSLRSTARSPSSSPTRKDPLVDGEIDRATSWGRSLACRDPHAPPASAAPTSDAWWRRWRPGSGWSVRASRASTRRSSSPSSRPGTSARRSAGWSCPHRSDPGSAAPGR